MKPRTKIAALSALLVGFSYIGFTDPELEGAARAAVLVLAWVQLGAGLVLFGLALLLAAELEEGAEPDE